MAGKSTEAAVDAFLEPLRRSVSCVTKTHVHVSGGYFDTDKVHALVLGDGDRVRLQGEPTLYLSLSQRYRIVEAAEERGPWKITTAGYFYEIADSDCREIVTFQWHPSGASPVTTPHLHLGSGAQVHHERLGDCHIPTSRVSIEQVIRLAIDLGAKHLRDDWDDVLAMSQAAHEHWRTWA